MKVGSARRAVRPNKPSASKRTWPHPSTYILRGTQIIMKGCAYSVKFVVPQPTFVRASINNTLAGVKSQAEESGGSKVATWQRRPLITIARIMHCFFSAFRMLVRTTTLHYVFAVVRSVHECAILTRPKQTGRYICVWTKTHYTCLMCQVVRGPRPTLPRPSLRPLPAILIPRPTARRI